MFDKISRRGLVAGIGGVIGAFITPFGTHEQYEVVKNETNVVQEDHVAVDVRLLENIIDLTTVSMFEYTMENVSNEAIEIRTHSVLPFGLLLFEETDPATDNIEKQWWPLLADQYEDAPNIEFVGEFSRSDYGPESGYDGTPSTHGDPPYKHGTVFGGVYFQTPSAHPDTTEEWMKTTLGAGESKTVQYRLPNFSAPDNDTATGTIRTPYGIWVNPEDDDMYQLELTVDIEVNQRPWYLP